MRIVLWSTGYCRGFGGAENMTNALVSRLDRLGFDTILVADGDPTRAPHSAYFPPLPERTELYFDTFPNPLLRSRRPAKFVASLWRYAGAALRLMYFLRRRRPDVVHMRVVSLDVFLLALYKRLFDYRLVVTFEGTDLTLARRSRLARVRVRFAVRHADAVAVVSRQLVDVLESYVGRGKAVCIPNAVDGAHAQTAAAHGSPAVAPDHFVFCGRLHPVKRVPLLVDIFKQCVDLGCDRKLYIVGDGEDRDAVASRIAQYRLEDRVVLTGALRHGEALAAVSRARCLLLASSDEGSPIVVLEAMSLGVPVIAPRVGGLPELVRHGETGYLFPPDDDARAREHILRVARSPEHARALGERGRDVARDRFTLDATVGEYVGLYRQALDGRRAPRSR